MAINMKKISLLALTLCFMSTSLLEAKFSLSSIIPLKFLKNSNPFTQLLPTFIPMPEQLFRILETFEDRSKLDFSKLSTERDPVFLPYNKEMVTVYADYKPDLNAETRLEKAKELRNWHAKVALASGLLTHFAFKYKPADQLHTTMFKGVVHKTGNYLAGLNMTYAGYKALQAHDLDSRIKAAQEGDGDMARALERKAIAYQVQDIE
jgi:hypothetical protein